jgi:serine/threonine-protein kinase
VLSVDAEAAMAAHLDDCAACQHTLELLAADGDSLTDVAREVGQEPGTQEAALKQALRAMHEAKGGTEAYCPVGGTSEPQFPFLDPPCEPGELGRLGHYVVQEVVGHGGMGVVFKAFDQRLNRVVAVKALAAQYATSATARARFEREARAAAGVSHDHVVPVYAVEENRGTPYLVMQLIVGKSLQQHIAEAGTLEIKEILRIGMQTASGLAAAHKQGLVHRDITPANILLENGVERVKITDFGLARAIDDASLSQSGVVAGTPLYMSPEQASGEAVDCRSDLFSLGSVIYTMATGHPPFRASGTMGVLRRVCEDTPRPMRESNPHVPPWLEAIVARLHAKDPADRFQNAQEVADLLGQHLAHLQEPHRMPLPASVRPQAAPVRAPQSMAMPVVALVCLSTCLIGGPVLVLFGLGFTTYWLLMAEPEAEGPLAPQAAPELREVWGPEAEAPMARAAEQVQLFLGPEVGARRDGVAAGWKGLPAHWQVKAGTLTGTSFPAGVEFNTFLCSDRTYRDFELRFQVRVKGAKPNSGVQIRSKLTDPGSFVVVGPQCDIGEDFWGNLFQEGPGAHTLVQARPGVLATIRKDEFNDYHIRCIGRRVRIAVNHFVTVDEDVPTLPAEGVIAWQFMPVRPWRSPSAMYC